MITLSSKEESRGALCDALPTLESEYVRSLSFWWGLVCFAMAFDPFPFDYVRELFDVFVYLVVDVEFRSGDGCSRNLRITVLVDVLYRSFVINVDGNRRGIFNGGQRL